MANNEFDASIFDNIITVLNYFRIVVTGIDMQNGEG